MKVIFFLKFFLDILKKYKFFKNICKLSFRFHYFLNKKCREIYKLEKS